jgi:hypothetical protein
LAKFCMEHRLALQINPPQPKTGAGPSASTNLHTKKREADILPKLYALDWALYHYPESNSIYKTVMFPNVIV